MKIRRQKDNVGNRRGPPITPVAERFAAFVLMPDVPTGCWLWTGALKKSAGKQLRYGLFSLGGRNNNTSAHRASWILHRGPIPAGMKVLHRCDVPSCVNPEHLFIGTQRDNVYDCMAKGRRKTPLGSQKPLAKLREAQIPVIRLMLKGDMTCKAIAAHFGVGRSAIAKVKAGESWRHA